MLTCTAAATAFANAGLQVVSEIRVLAGGEIVRFLTTITNVGAAEATIDSVDLYTDFGSSGYLYDFENQAESSIVVPAEEIAPFETDLNAVGARWIVHWEEDDAPGGLVIGAGDSAAPAEWTDVDGDTYEAAVTSFAIPAGQSRAVLWFATWDPQTLIDGGYTNSSPAASLLNASADEIVAGMAQFTEITGVLASGLNPAVPLVNWGPVDVVEEEPEEEPELAVTGAGDALALGLAAVVLLGLGIIFTIRRRASV